MKVKILMRIQIFIPVTNYKPDVQVKYQILFFKNIINKEGILIKITKNLVIIAIRFRTRY